MSESRLRAGELCAGYGGLSVAIEWVRGRRLLGWPRSTRLSGGSWPDDPSTGTSLRSTGPRCPGLMSWPAAPPARTRRRPAAAPTWPIADSGYSP